MYALTDTEKATYYANLVAVACADGKLADSEEEQLAAIRKDLKLKKDQIALAEKTGMDASWVPQPVGTWANQIDNIETMVRIAMVDDELSRAETRVIASLAAAIGLTQDQMDKILDDVKCRRWVDPERKTEAPDTLLDFTPPNTGVAIEFAESTSGAFQEILELAEAAPERQRCVKNRKTWYLAAWPNGTLADAIPLALLLAPLQNKGVWVAGKQRSWRKTFGFALCAAKRTKAYRTENYCFGLEGSEHQPNPWGCVEIGMEWCDWADWFLLGQWEQDGKKLLWRFDKPQIRHKINTALEEVAYCPHLTQGLPEAFLMVLPDTVDPFNDDDWTYREANSLTPGALEVTLKRNKYGELVNEDLCVLGVAPKSPDLYKTLLNKAFSKLEAENA